MTTIHETSCPRAECDGTIEMVEESSESYTAGGLSVWTEHYLIMDGESCSEGHTFLPDEVKQIEHDATEECRTTPYGGWP